MGLLQWITQACDNLTATTAPTVDALGLHMVIAMATIMLVWFGAQEALASAHGGPGFSMGRFLNLFMLLTFAYVLVAFYDSAIPGVGYSLKGFINGGAAQLVRLIGTDSEANMQASAVASAIDCRPWHRQSLCRPLLCSDVFLHAGTAGVLRRDPQPDSWIWGYSQHSGRHVWSHHDPVPRVR
jgi:hypothetical protein